MGFFKKGLTELTKFATFAISKKKATKKMSRIIFTLIALTAAVQYGWAYDTQIDNIFYNLADEEASVTFGDEFHQYEGFIDIPSVIIYKDQEYRVTSIGEQAFSGCTGLTGVKIPSSITSIKSEAFFQCKGLTEIIIPSSVKTLGTRALSECNGLTSITIPSSIKAVSDYLFFGCKNLESVNLPSSITSIGGGAFEDCVSLTSITLPSALKGIGIGTFRGCVRIRYVKIPQNVTSIGSSAFYNCSDLRAVSLPSSLTSIGTWAFYNCGSLDDVTCFAATPPTVHSNSFYIYENLHVPAGAKEAYKSQPVWKSFLVSEDAGGVLVKGDLNDDLDVNVGDVTMLIDLILTAREDDERLRQAADVNNDKAINVGDLTTLISIILSNEEY